jgi:hypothetical protein
MADGSTRLVCRFNVQYSLAAVDAQKHQFGLSSLLISTPDCDEPWNLVVRVR